MLDLWSKRMGCNHLRVRRRSWVWIWNGSHKGCENTVPGIWFLRELKRKTPVINWTLSHFLIVKNPIKKYPKWFIPLNNHPTLFLDLHCPPPLCSDHPNPLLFKCILRFLLKCNGLVKFVFFWLKAHLLLWTLKQFLRVYVGGSWVELSCPEMSFGSPWALADRLLISSWVPTKAIFQIFQSISPHPPCTAELDRGSVIWDTQNESVKNDFKLAGWKWGVIFPPQTHNLFRN